MERRKTRTSSDPMLLFSHLLVLPALSLQQLVEHQLLVARKVILQGKGEREMCFCCGDLHGQELQELSLHLRG